MPNVDAAAPPTSTPPYDTPTEHCELSNRPRRDEIGQRPRDIVHPFGRSAMIPETNATRQ